MIEWGKVPWSMWAYAGLAVVGYVLAGVGSVPVAGLIFYIAFSLAWLYFLLRGIRWLWIATMVLFIGFTVLDIVDGGWRWPGGLLGIAQIILLVLPPTQRFFAKGEAVVAT